MLLSCAICYVICVWSLSECHVFSQTVYTLLYMSLLSTCSSSLFCCVRLPAGGRALSAFYLFVWLITYQTANLDKIFKTSKSLCVKVAILLHFAYNHCSLSELKESIVNIINIMEWSCWVLFGWLQQVDGYWCHECKCVWCWYWCVQVHLPCCRSHWA